MLYITARTACFLAAIGTALVGHGEDQEFPAGIRTVSSPFRPGGLKGLAAYPSPDVTAELIGDLLSCELSKLVLKDTFR